MDVLQIARVCHEANREYCASIGDPSQRSWDDAEAWQRESAVKGVEFALANPDELASSQHEAWMRDKTADGWIYGPRKDWATKQHPCMVAYAELPLEQRIKDHLFRGIVRAFAAAE